MARNTAALLKASMGAAQGDQQPARAQPVSTSTQHSTRAGKVQIGAWLSPDYRSSLRAIQVQQPDKNTQSLISEALNDLFAKYRVPTIRD
jgi:hypothetical protein